MLMMMILIIGHLIMQGTVCWTNVQAFDFSQKLFCIGFEFPTVLLRLCCVLYSTVPAAQFQNLKCACVSVLLATILNDRRHLLIGRTPYFVVAAFCFVLFYFLWVSAQFEKKMFHKFFRCQKAFGVWSACHGLEISTVGEVGVSKKHFSCRLTGIVLVLIH